MASPRNRNRSGLAAATAAQTGCGFSWLAPDPKAMRCNGEAGASAPGDRPEKAAMTRANANDGRARMASVSGGGREEVRDVIRTGAETERGRGVVSAPPL